VIVAARFRDADRAIQRPEADARPRERGPFLCGIEDNLTAIDVISPTGVRAIKAPGAGV
jgi:hypothetical protein